MTEFSGAEVQIQEDDGGVEEDPEEHLLSSISQILICEIIYRSCVFIYMTWEERGGFMSRGAYILEIWRFLILYTVSLGRPITQIHRQTETVLYQDKDMMTCSEIFIDFDTYSS